MSEQEVTSIDLTLLLPTESASSIEATKEFEHNGNKFKLTYTIDRLVESDENVEVEKKEPLLQKHNTIVDKNDPNVKYYVYKKTYTIETEEGPITKEQTIKRKYIKHSPIISPREVATSSIIDELLNSEFKSKSALSLYNNHYLKLMKADNPDIKPYSYAAFLNRWIKALSSTSEKSTPN